MAAVAEKMVDAAIEWMVQSILGNLFNENLEAWIHGVELADDVQKLKSAMRYVQMFVEATKERKINNVPLGMSPGDLKELLYDAEDVMDELDYYRLQEQIASGDNSDGTASAVINTATSSSWLSSSIQLGKNLFGSFGNFISTGKSRGKRKREADDHNIAANTQLGRNKKSELSLRIQHIASKLRGAGDDVRDGLKIDSSSFVATSNQSQRTLKHTTSYIVEHKVYGRDAEVESILKLMAITRSDPLTVLPIVGMGGVGKTTLAQLVYEHASQFQIRIWICVSLNFDILKLTRELLECVSGQMQTQTGNLNKLQEDLQKQMESKRFLIVLDDVWDDMNEHSWNNLIAPLRRNQVMGNVIVVTTRKLHIAKMTGTVEPVKLDVLERADLWLLFEACAFGDEKHQVHPSLYNIGKQIAQKLSGSPLEAKAVGALLGREISIDHWTDVLNSEKWKSLWDGGGIMPALKLSYDHLPGHSQQCFRYCCLFPKDYQFDGAELVRLWISQGFVHGRHADKILQDTAKDCLAELVNSGFLQLVERGRSSRHFVMHDLMHDLAWEVSRADFLTVNDLECEEILPTVRHLSIVRKEQHLNAFPYESFEKSHLPVRQLRSLVFIGQYDSRVLKYLQNVFREAQSLRVLYVSTTYAGFDCLISNLVGCTHIRYIKVRLIDIGGGFLPQALTNFFHLQVLHVISHTAPTLPSGVNNLASLQHLVTREETLSTVAGIQSMTALQVLHKFKVQNASGFDIRQLRSLNHLVLLGIYQLENVRNGQEASEARLIGKRHLEDLLLSWDGSSTSGGASKWSSAEVLEGLKPHKNLKHLQITGCNSSNSPRWLGTDLSVTSLQSLHLENCKEWRVLPPLEKLPSLRKLKLINMPINVVEVAIPCLEELVLIELPRLEKCVSTSELACHLQTLIIKNCPELKDFAPFTLQNFFSSEVEQNSWMSGFESTNEGLSSAKALQKKWLSGVRVLTIHACPHLILLHPLPPASNTQVSIEGLSKHPTIKRSSGDLSVMSSDELRVLDAKILAFQNLTDAISLQIKYCPNLVSLAFEGLMHLTNLSRLSIVSCGNLVSSYSMPDAVPEGWQATNCPIFPYLTHLEIKSCGGVAGKWLTQMLPHMQSLWVLDLEDCPHITSISIHRTRQNEESGSITSASNCQAVVPACLCQGGFQLHIPLNVLSTLKKFCVRSCPEMKLHSSNEGFEGFITLTRLQISGCPMLLSSADERLSLPSSTSEVLIEHLPRKVQPYFPENQTSLKALFVRCSPNLQSLWLHSCTALELLRIHDCAQLVALEGLQYLSSLRSLEIEMNPELSAAWFWKHHEQEERGDPTCLLPPSIEILSIMDLREEAMPYLLSAHLPLLSELVVRNSPNLTTLQLGSLTALKNLRIHNCNSLTSLEGLQCLGNLTDLKVSGCSNMLPCLEVLSQKAGASNIFLPELVRLEVDGIPSLTTSSSSTLPRSSVQIVPVDEQEVVLLGTATHPEAV